MARRGAEVFLIRMRFFDGRIPPLPPKPSTSELIRFFFHSHPQNPPKLFSAILILHPPPRIRPPHREHQVFQSGAGVLSGRHGLRRCECGREGLVFTFFFAFFCFIFYAHTPPPFPPPNNALMLASLIHLFVLFLSMPRHKKIPGYATDVHLCTPLCYNLIRGGGGKGACTTRTWDE